MKRCLSLLMALCLLLTGCSVGGRTYVPHGGGLAREEGDTSPTSEPTLGGEEQSFSLVYYSDRSLNPLTCTDYTNRTLFSLIYQGLFAVDRSYTAQPILCREYTVSQDMMAYTFYLNDATFSDGTPVTAQDVAACLTFAKSGQGSVYQGRFFHMVSAVAQGAAVVVTMDTAYEDLPILLDVPIVKASEINAQQPLGTGPYLLNRTTGGMRLRRNPNWWCQATLPVTASSIPLVQAESNSQIRDQFQFSDVGLVCADPGTDTYADFRSDYELWDCESGIFLYMACNNESEFFQEYKLQSAITFAIDRDTLVEDNYRGFARSATLPASPQSPYYSEGLAARYGYDAEKFSQAVSSAGAVGETVRLLVNADDSLRLRVAKAIAEMLTAGGLVVQIVECSSANFLTRLAERNYELYLSQTKLSTNMDLSAFFYVTGTLSYGAMDDLATYSLCLEALANRGNYYNLHQKIMNEGRLIPILFRSYAIYATRGLMTGLTPARDNVFFYTLRNVPGQPNPSEPTGEPTDGTATGTDDGSAPPTTGPDGTDPGTTAPGTTAPGTTAGP